MDGFELPKSQIGSLIIFRESIYSLKWYKRWLIRFAHRKTLWASDYCVHECGYYPPGQEQEANDAALAMYKQYGGVWMVKPIAVGAVTGPEPVKLGPTIMYGGGAKAMYNQMYKKPNVLIAMPLGEIQEQEKGLKGVLEQVDRLWRKQKTAGA